MNLNDLVNMIYTENADLTVYVFDSEDGRDEFREHDAFDCLLFSVRSPNILRSFLQNKFAEAKVLCLCLVNGNTVDVVIEDIYKNKPKEDTKTDREKLIDLMVQAKKEEPEYDPFSEFLADFLLAHGVKIESGKDR